jgi:predicted transcriptional regulator
MEAGMTKSVLLSARITPKLNAKLTRLAADTDRTKSKIVSQALQAFVESEADFLASIEKGRRDFKAGRFKEHSVFMAELRSKYVKR